MATDPNSFTTGLVGSADPASTQNAINQKPPKASGTKSPWDAFSSASDAWSNNMIAGKQAYMKALIAGKPTGGGDGMGWGNEGSLWSGYTGGDPTRGGSGMVTQPPPPGDGSGYSGGGGAPVLQPPNQGGGQGYAGQPPVDDPSRQPSPIGGDQHFAGQGGQGWAIGAPPDATLQPPPSVVPTKTPDATLGGGLVASAMPQTKGGMSLQGMSAGNPNGASFGGPGSSNPATVPGGPSSGAGSPGSNGQVKAPGGDPIYDPATGMSVLALSGGTAGHPRASTPPTNPGPDVSSWANWANQHSSYPGYQFLATEQGHQIAAEYGSFAQQAAQNGEQGIEFVHWLAAAHPELMNADTLRDYEAKKSAHGGLDTYNTNPNGGARNYITTGGGQHEDQGSAKLAEYQQYFPKLTRDILNEYYALEGIPGTEGLSIEEFIRGAHPEIISDSDPGTRLFGRSADTYDQHVTYAANGAPTFTNRDWTAIHAAVAQRHAPQGGPDPTAVPGSPAANAPPTPPAPTNTATPESTKTPTGDPLSVETPGGGMTTQPGNGIVPPVGYGANGSPATPPTVPPPGGTPPTINPNAPDAMPLSQYLHNLLHPSEQIAQDDAARQMRAQGALTGATGSGGFGETFGRGMSNLTAQQSAKEGEFLTSMTEAQQKNLTDLQIANLNASTQRYGIDSQKAIAEMQDSTQRFGITTTNDLQRWLNDASSNTVAKYGIDNQLVMAKLAAQTGLSQAQIQAGAQISSAQISAAMQSAIADKNNAAAAARATQADDTARLGINENAWATSSQLYMQYLQLLAMMSPEQRASLGNISQLPGFVGG